MYLCLTELLEIELIICIKMDVALNNLQKLMCHETQPTNQITDGEAIVLEIWGMWNTLSLPLLPGSLWHGMILTVRVTFIQLIDLFANY